MSADHPRGRAAQSAAAVSDAPSPARDRQLIAFVATWDREMRNLSVAELAGLAGVAVEVIEPVERGEPVGDDMLRHVAVTLGRAGNAFA
jgi:hypothetical protein